MCRLYGFRSTTPRKLDGELLHSSNSLLAQSLHDENGKSNPHGWGLGTYDGAAPSVVRRPEPAFTSNAFRVASARAFTSNTVAHVRRATVGGIRTVNTQPFVHGDWLFVHNGNLGAFDGIRPRIAAAIGPQYRRFVQGETDSEHVFHWLLSLRNRRCTMPLLEVVRAGAHQLIAWCREEDPAAEVALTIIMTNGAESVGMRYGRSLWCAERDGERDGRAVVLASEPVTGGGGWKPIPDENLFHIDRNLRLRVQPLWGAPGARAAGA
jgi:glutamine amidotransferase